VLAAAASLLAVFALVLRARAKDDARVATARQLAASAEANLNVDPERSILLGIQAAETTRRHDGSILPEAEQALHDALATSRVLARSPGVGRRSGIGHVVALAPDAATFVAADLDHKTVSVRDAHTGKKLATLPGHSAQVFAVAYSPNGRFIAAGSADGTLRLWKASSRKIVHVVRAHRGAVFATRFSADGIRLATLGGDRAVRVWDVRSGRRLQSLPNVHERTRAPAVWGEGVAFVGGDRIAVAPWSREGGAPSAVVAKVFELSSGKQVGVVNDPAGPTQTVDIDVSPNGKLLVASHAEGPLQLYRLSDGRQLDVEQGSSAGANGAILDLEFSRDGKFLATGGVDGFAKIWEVAHGKLREVLTLRGHDNPVGSVSLNRDGTRLASWGQVSREARIWDVSPAGRGEVLTLPGPQSKPEWHSDIAFTPDGRRLVANSGPAGTVRVWSVHTGKELLRLDQGATDRAPAHGVIGIDVDSNGSRLATAGADGRVRIFDAHTGKQLLALRHQHCVPHGLCVVNQAVFSPDGSKIATTGWDATIGIFDARSGRRLRVLRGHQPGFLGSYVAEWTRDGTRLLSTGHDGMRIWDVSNGRRLLSLPEGGGPGESGAWSPDEKEVLTESGLGSPVWDASTGKRLRLLATGAPVADLVFSRGGSRLAIATIDEQSSTRIWDWPSGVEALKLPEGGLRVALSPDGKLLAGVQAEPKPFVHVWTLDPERLLQIARHRVTRSLAEDECRRYLHRSCATAK
jgi:WD40 repeat protein